MEDLRANQFKSTILPMLNTKNILRGHQTTIINEKKETNYWTRCKKLHNGFFIILNVEYHYLKSLKIKFIPYNNLFEMLMIIRFTIIWGNYKITLKHKHFDFTPIKNWE